MIRCDVRELTAQCGQPRARVADCAGNENEIAGLGTIPADHAAGGSKTERRDRDRQRSGCGGCIATEKRKREDILIRMQSFRERLHPGQCPIARQRQ
jgi:hypothetical protein